MKYFGLVWKNVWRKKIRTSLTILSVLVAFLLFALLSAIGYAFRAGADVADAERLVVIEKISLINPLPIAYKNRIAATEGVAGVTHASWFGGYYQDPRNQFGQFPTEPYEYFALYPELDIAPEQLEAFAKNRTGAVIGKEIADRFGIKVGDRIPLISTIWPNADGGNNWEFDIEGIFSTTEPRGSSAFMLMNYDYFEESRQYGKGTVGWIFHDADYYVTNQRDQAFKTTIENDYPGISIVAEQGISDPARAEELASAMLLQNPELDGIYVTWAEPADGVLAALRSAGNAETKVVTLDLSEPIALDMVRGGNVAGIVADEAYELGRAMAAVGLKALLGEESPAFVVAPALTVTADNVAEGWQQSLHRDAPASVLAAQ